MPQSVRKEAHTAVITVSGRFTGGEPVDQFRASWSGLIAEGVRAFVVDLEGVTMIDSSGMGALVRCKTSLTSVGGQMRIACASDPVRMALRMTHLDKTFEFHPDEASALASLSAGEPATSN